MNDSHQAAAIEVWDALPQAARKWIARSDFITAFTLGRVSMKACYEKSELLRVGDEPKPFSQTTTTTK